MVCVSLCLSVCVIVLLRSEQEIFESVLSALPRSGAEALLSARADVAAANGEGNTALMFAAHGGHEPVCTALLEAYAPAESQNQFGLTAEQAAGRVGRGGGDSSSGRRGEESRNLDFGTSGSRGKISILAPFVPSRLRSSSDIHDLYAYRKVRRMV